jgi:hypothetical protein
LARRRGSKFKRILIPGEVLAAMTPEQRKKALRRAHKQNERSGLEGPVSSAQENKPEFKFSDQATLHEKRQNKSERQISSYTWGDDAELLGCQSGGPALVPEVEVEPPEPPELPTPGTIGAEIARWIEKHCRIPEGKDVGKPFILDRWQREAIEAIYNNPAGHTRRFICSLARKNGKTSFCAALVLVHLIGPMAGARRNTQLYSAALSRDQAALIFACAARIIRFNPEMIALVSITESSKTLINRELGIVYRALAAEAGTAFGLNPSLVIHDELGQICPRKQIKPLQNMGFQTAT